MRKADENDLTAYRCIRGNLIKSINDRKHARNNKIFDNLGASIFKFCNARLTGKRKKRHGLKPLIL
jgi:hypothetical protein